MQYNIFFVMTEIKVNFFAIIKHLCLFEYILFLPSENHHSHLDSKIILSKSALRNPPPHHSLLLPHSNSKIPPLLVNLSHLHFDCYFYKVLVHLQNLSFVAKSFQAM